MQPRGLCPWTEKEFHDNSTTIPSPFSSRPASEAHNLHSLGDTAPLQKASDLGDAEGLFALLQVLTWCTHANSWAISQTCAMY